MPYCLILLIGIILGTLLGAVITVLKLDKAQIEVMKNGKN